MGVGCANLSADSATASSLSLSLSVSHTHNTHYLSFSTPSLLFAPHIVFPQPNVQVSYMRGDHSGAVLALRDIKEGEELCINYTDTNQDEELRQQDLRHYGFLCACGKCARERKQTL